MTKKVLQIPRPERRRLLAMARKARAPVFQERCFIILALARRIDGREVARTFGVAPAHVSRTRSIYRAEGIEGLMDKRCNNGHRKATKAFRSAVADLLLKVPTDFQWMSVRPPVCLRWGGRLTVDGRRRPWSGAGAALGCRPFGGVRGTR